MRTPKVRNWNYVFEVGCEYGTEFATNGLAAPQPAAVRRLRPQRARGKLVLHAQTH